MRKISYTSIHLQDAPVPRVEAPDLSRKRDLCLQEIVETERNYVTALNMLCTKFLEPLKKVLSEEQIKNIFGCIPVSLMAASHFSSGPDSFVLHIMFPIEDDNDNVADLKVFFQ